MPRLIVLMALLAAAPATAGVLVDSRGFESPFSAGSLAGQQGWSMTPGSNTAVVQSSVVQSGANALRIDRVSGDGYWAVLGLTPSPGRYLTIAWDMRVESSGLASGFGPFFGVTAYDDRGTALPQVATLGVDANTNEVLVQAGGSGTILPTGAAATPGQWNHYEIVLDFIDDVYYATVNAQLVASETFIDVGFGIDTITDADIATFAAAGDVASQQATGTAYFDNFEVFDGLYRTDYNGDGVVDAADYVVWRNLEGSTGSGLAGDGDGDGDVDSADLEAWRAGYGLGAAVSSSAAVPEPATAWAALAGLAAAARCSRRR